MSDFIGILPAAGVASRLRPLRYPKELMPIFYAVDRTRGSVQPTLAAEYSLEAMCKAGVQRCLVVVSDSKPEIQKYFGDGAEFGLPIAYLQQTSPVGLADAVDKGFPWLRNHLTALALPDTVFYPHDAIRRIREDLLRTKADLVLGVFPHDEPELLGPVRMEQDGSVIEVLEKPSKTDLRNTWGTAVWSPRFTEFLHDSLAAGTESRRQSLGDIFNSAAKAGLQVRAVRFEGGSYFDLGRPQSIAALILPDKRSST